MKFCMHVSLFCLLLACSAKPQPEEAQSATKTPVSVTTIRTQPMSAYLSLNGTTTYLKKETVRATVAGYILKNNIVMGSSVRRGQQLFDLQTKEARALQSVNIQDTLLRFSGTIPVKASLSGVVSQVYQQQGAYVQDGDSLASVLVPGSLVFLLNVPFEDASYVKAGTLCQIILSASDTLQGTVANAVPRVNVGSQVEQFMVRLPSSSSSPTQVIPENLNVTIRVPTTSQPQAQTLPRQSVLTNETQTDFWVMKLINDTTAIKVPIQKGIDADQRVAIDSPQFTAQDRFLTQGAYGLPDTAYVSINQPTP